MTQTEKGRKSTGTPDKARRPGQRQQERLMRLQRRRRRRQIWLSVVAALFLIAAGVVVLWQVQQYQQRVIAQQNATATAVSHKQATATAIAVNATATVVSQDCFVSPAGTQTDPIYSATATPTAGPTTSPHITGQPVTLKDGLKYIDIKVGKGTAAKKNSNITLEYTGWLASTCQKFDSSYDRGGQPLPLTLGQGQVIKGFDEGLIGMKPGGIRRLDIPPSLGYGEHATGPIPANSTLIFDVTLISVK